MEVFFDEGSKLVAEEFKNFFKFQANSKKEIHRNNENFNKTFEME